MRALLVLTALAQPAAADDWRVLVIGNPSRSAPTAFADAHMAAETFRRMALGPVAMQREIGADALAQALDSLSGSHGVVIYFAGPIGSGPAGPMLMGQGGGDARGAIDPLLARLAATGTREAVLLIEDCAGGDGMAGRLRQPELPAGLMVYMAATAGPSGTCPERADRLTDRLAGSDADTLQGRLTGLWTGAATLDPLAITPGTTPDAAPTAAGAALVEVVESDVIRIAPVTVATIAPTEVIAGTVLDPAPEPDDPTTPTSASAVPAAEPAAVPAAEPAVFRPLRDEDMLALPVAAGMPQPSIIVGIIRPDPPEPEAAPDLPQIAYDDLAAREALRQDDPALFRTLVESGALDPPPESVVIALQTELQRSGCYTAAIDGQWGNGSRRAVDRFAEAAGLTPVTRDPDATLFRQMLLAGPVECPAPVAEAAPARSTAPRAADPAPAPSPARAPEPAPAPQPSAPSGGLSNSALGGVFR